MFPTVLYFWEDNDIQIEHLVRYGMGKQFFMDVDKTDEARARTRLGVGELKPSGFFARE